ncbi:hypothetical protein JJB99_23615 [Bradyrhizobium diazoefficiens]|uniref:hypothetical protein n=1 Tax=Bradyrhizobium diazoefficiens TaxID=1355477 RepID=UPI0019095E83|nr:hypothetical protein [Bradyrhizobium diazoefficiens]QQO12454.1 hypothetical protein JJB99_23615 [Bradyrhizobium diazoefficiens]
MGYDPAYLGASLNDRAYDAAILGEAVFNAIMRRNAAAGRLASGVTLVMFGEAIRKTFGEEFDKAALFAFNLTGENGPDVVKPLDYFAGRIVDLLMDKMIACGGGTGLDEPTVAPHFNKLRVELGEMRTRKVRDFTHGIMGNERMKKDPVVSIVNTQSNSPGAVQQVGVGEFSQSAIIQHHQQLVAAIDRALASPEFQQLEQTQKEGFRDIAEVVKDEAVKPAPDPVKLKRWSERLVGLAKEVGMRVAVSEIGQAITQILGAAI